MRWIAFGECDPEAESLRVEIHRRTNIADDKSECGASRTRRLGCRGELWASFETPVTGTHLRHG